MQRRMFLKALGLGTMGLAYGGQLFASEVKPFGPTGYPLSKDLRRLVLARDGLWHLGKEILGKSIDVEPVHRSVMGVDIYNNKIYYDEKEINPSFLYGFEHYVNLEGEMVAFAALGSVNRRIILTGPKVTLGVSECKVANHSFFIPRIHGRSKSAS